MRMSYLTEWHTRDKFTVVIIGQPEEHLMDWLGCNFKYLALPPAFRRTFKTKEEASAYKKKLYKKTMLLKAYAAEFKGSGFHESRMA